MCQLNEPSSGSYSSASTPVSDNEYRAQFSFWAMSAPLVIGADLTTLTAATLRMRTNTEVIAIDQNALGLTAKRITAADVACGTVTCSVSMKKTTRGYAVAFFNPDPSAAHSVAVTWAQTGSSGTFNMRDAWAHADIGSSSTMYTGTAV